ncbi:MAG: hypothetical protein QOI98_1494 [Solirubrobacteraceae bacterium]|nr:hypothetical protein [Solirubrobacteraceae bacterium]
MGDPRRAKWMLAAVILAGLVAGIARGHPLGAVAFAVATPLAWRAGGFAAVAAVCVGTIALGSSSIGHVKAAGTDERWVALFTLAAWPLISRRRPGEGANPLLVVAAAALVALAALSVFWSVDVHVTIGRTAAFAVLLWVALIVFPLHVRSAEERIALGRWLAGLCVAGAVAALILGLVDAGVARVGGEAAQASAEQGLPRAYGALQGWLENANTLGLWCVLLAPCLLALPRRNAVLASLPVLAAVLLSQSRSALFVAIVIGLAVLPISNLRKLALSAGVVAAIVAIALSPAKSVFNHTAFRKFEDAGSTVRILTGAREEAWTATFQLVPVVPVEGYGFGTGERVFEIAGGKDYFRYFVGSTPSDGYLLMLLELGAVGSLLLLITLAIALREAWPARRQWTRRPFFFMAVGVLIAGLVESIFTSPGSPFTILLWAGLGVATAPALAGAVEPAPVADPGMGRPPSAAGAAWSRLAALAGRRPSWPRSARGALGLSAAIGAAITGLSLIPWVNERLAAAAPSLYDNVVARLPGSPLAGPDPPFGVPAELKSLRTASAHLPTGTHVYPFATSGRAQGELNLAARLYLPNALPVRRPGDADWIVTYKAPTLAPPGVLPRVVYTLGPDIFLVKVR